MTFFAVKFQLLSTERHICC